MRFPKKTFAFTVLIVLILSCGWLWHIFGSFKVGGQLPILFENMGEHLRRGEVNVDYYAAMWETFFLNNKYYVYYGVFPAFLRLFLNAIIPSWYGNWGGISCLLADLCITVSSFLIIYEGIKYSPICANKFFKNFLLFLSVCTLIFGGPTIVSLLRPFVWEELIMWGCAFNLIAIYGFILFLNNTNSNFAIFLMSLFASLAFITRTTFGIPIYLLCGYVAFYLIYKKSLTKTKVALFSLGILGIVFQLWYNYKRFGSLFTFFPKHPSHPFYECFIYGGLLNLYRIKDLVFIYLIPNSLKEYISSIFPFFYCFGKPIKGVSLFIPTEKFFVIPMLLVSPYVFFILFNNLFLYFLQIKEKLKFFNISMVVIFVSLLLECLIILCYPTGYERYKLDFLPFITINLFYFFRTVRQKKLLYLCCFLFILSIVNNTLFTIGYLPYRH